MGKPGFLKLTIFIFSFAIQLNASQRLVLVGGGDISRPALQQFVKWGGGRKSHVLVISWATEDPEGAYADFVAGLKSLGNEGPGSYEAAVIPRQPNMPQEAENFLNQLARATAVFFTGGDQNVLMKRLLSDSGFIPAIHHSFNSGIVFGGSSAGTAIMTETMLTGNGDLTKIQTDSVETSTGLGLVTGYLVDQHFIKRQRQNRIFSLLLRGKENFAIGIDEDNAISIEDNRTVKVLGTGLVMTLSRIGQQNGFKIGLFKDGDQFEVPRQ